MELSETRKENRVEKNADKRAVKDFTDLIVWQNAHQIRIDAYFLAGKLPPEEKFNLSSQIKRSAASIAANIAEGYGRYSYQENIQFCRQARGSLDETRDHLIFIRSIYKNLAKDCDKLETDCLNCRQILNGYINYLKKRKEED